jgi:hypothetical protein
MISLWISSHYLSSPLSVFVCLFPFFFAIYKQAFDSLLAETSGDDRSRTIATSIASIDSLVLPLASSLTNGQSDSESENGIRFRRVYHLVRNFNRFIPTMKSKNQCAQMKNSFHAALQWHVLPIMIDETKCLHHVLYRQIYEFVSMRCRKIFMLDASTWFESEVMEVFLYSRVCRSIDRSSMCVRVHFIFASHSVRSSKWTLAVRMLHHLCVFSVIL